MSDGIENHGASRGDYLRILLGTAALTGFFVLGQHNYLFFHSLMEIASVIVACAVFLIFWNARRFLDSGLFLFLGVACLFTGILDLMHVLTYPGMSVFAGIGADESIQLKTAGRWIAALSCLVAPLFLRRRLNLVAAVAVYGAILGLVVCLVFAGALPDCYVEGVEMTLAQRLGRGLSSLGFLAAAGLLIHLRNEFHRSVFRLLLIALVASSVSEFASALSTTLDGSLKVVAHLSEVVSFYLVYKAFVEVGLRKPYDLLFLRLKRSEQSLRESAQYFETVFDAVGAGLLAVDRETLVVLDANRAAAEEIALPKGRIVGKKCHDFLACPAADGKCPLVFHGEPIEPSLRELLRGDGRRVPVLQTVTLVAGDSRPILLECFLGFSELVKARGAPEASEPVVSDAAKSAPDSQRQPAGIHETQTHWEDATIVIRGAGKLPEGPLDGRRVLR